MPQFATPSELFVRLDALGIRTRTVRHPPAFRVEQAKALRGELPGGHLKNLFVRNPTGAMWLLVALEDRKLDLRAIGQRLGAGKLSFGSPERLLAHLGVSPGSVTPFAAINDPEGRVRVVLDADVLAHDPVHCHPLTNEMTTAIAPADLLRFLGDCGHAPEILALDEK